MKEKEAVYRYSYNEAKRLNELEEWENSAKENAKCAELIKEVIDNNYDGTKLKSESIKEIIAEFGYHRTAFVLACTVNNLSSDSRFRAENKEWAKSVTHIKDAESNNWRVDSHPEIVNGLVNQFKREYSKLELINQSQINENSKHYEGKIIAIKANCLAERYLNQRDQIYVATSGFGCDPNKAGRAVFTICLGDGEKVRWDRSQVLGVIKDKNIPTWANEKYTELGFKKENREVNMKEKTIKILKIEEGKLPYEKEIPNELRALQKEVDGLIQVYPLENGTLAIINEEGKINGMSPNRWIGDEIICGPFFICGDDEEDFKSLSEEEISKLKEEFSEIPKFTGQEKQLEPRIEVYGFGW